MKNPFLRIGTLALVVSVSTGVLCGQEIPKPKPVTPPPVIPGTKPPAKPGLIPPSQQDELQTNRAMPAAQKIVGEGQDTQVQPFVDDDTLAVVRIDASTLDLAKYQQWFGQMLDAAKIDAAQAKQAREASAAPFKDGGDWLARFKQAGGTRLYVVASLADVPERPPFLVVPIQANSDGKGLIDLFAPNAAPQPTVAEKIGDAVIVGQAATLSRLKAAPSSKPRPELSTALAAVDGPIRFALIPGQGPRQMLEGAAPTLPEEFGGVSAKVVSRGMTWLAASISAPPQVSLQVVIQAKDAAAADQLRDLELKAEKADAIQQHASELKLPFDLNAVMALLVPKVQGDQVITTVDADHMRELLATAGIPALIAARQQASAMVSLNNMRQILLGCVMYAQENKDTWPDALAQIEKFLGKDAAAHVMTNPAHPERNPAYIYRKPAAPATNTASIVVLYEAHEGWPGTVAAGFADGHVEVFHDQAAFEKALGR